MLIRFLVSVGGKPRANPGDTREVPDAEALRFIASRAAVAVVETAAVSPTRTAMKKKPKPRARNV